MALQRVTRSPQEPRIDSQHKRPRSEKRICPLNAIFQQPVSSDFAPTPGPVKRDYRYLRFRGPGKLKGPNRCGIRPPCRRDPERAPLASDLYAAFLIGFRIDAIFFL